MGRPSSGPHRRPDWAPPGWHHGPPGRFIRRRLFGLLLAFVIVAMVVGTIAGLVFSAVSNAGPWSWLLLVVMIMMAVAARRTMARAWRPVGDLIDATARLGSGDDGVRVDTRLRGPLRGVAVSFNQMAERLDAEEERRQRFLADVGHELETPLTVLRGEIEALVDGVRQPDPERLTSLLADVTTVERLVEDLRTLSLAEARRLELHREELDLAEVVGDSLRTFQPTAQDQGVTIEWDDGGPAPMSGDPVRLRQIVMNLVTNALRAMPEGGIMAVDIGREPDAIVLSVRDTGRGIDPQRLQSLFDRYEKSVDSTGSGLGLTIVRDLVEAHGGSVTAANGPSTGAIFTAVFPTRGDEGSVGGEEPT